MVEHDTMQIHEFLIHWVSGVQNTSISPIDTKIVTKMKTNMFLLWSVSHNTLFLPIVKKFFQIWTFLKCPKMKRVPYNLKIVTFGLLVTIMLSFSILREKFLLR